MGLSYSDAGVDIDAGNEAVQRIARLVSRTKRPEQIGGLGGFAGMFGMPAGLTDPVLVSCADGVGTKVLVAIAMGRHDTVGIDLVAMNVNDLIVTGAAPMFVLDYIACAKVDPATIEALVAGVVEGCVQSGAALLGGETAELPGMYQPGHYDLAAFAVGVVERAAVLGPKRVREGDIVLGLPSSGLHSNGYSLARKALLSPEHAGLSLTAPLPSDPTQTVGEALLTPTRIYVPHLAAARTVDGALHAAAHITGGGLIENPPRVLPDTLAMELDLGRVDLPPVLAAVADAGVARPEMRRTFNCGVGMLLVVDPAGAASVAAAIAAHDGTVATELGTVVARNGDSQVHLTP